MNYSSTIYAKSDQLRWTQESGKQPLAKATLENMAEVGGNKYSTLETYPPTPQSQAAVGQSTEKQN